MAQVARRRIAIEHALSSVRRCRILKTPSAFGKKEVERCVHALYQTMADLVAIQRDLLQLVQQTVGQAGGSQQLLDATSALLSRTANVQQQLLLQQEHAASLTGPAHQTQLTVSELTAERVNIREPDGTLRLMLCNTQRSPGYVMDGKPFGEPDKQRPGGIYFFNDEGNECGGLVFGGKRIDEHSYEAGGGFFFDQYRQDQVVGMMHTDVNGQRHAGFCVWDRPDMPITEWTARCVPVFDMPDGPEKEAALAQLRKERLIETTRVFMGKTTNRDACLNLYDVQGNLRLRLVVRADGTPAIECLNEQGEVTERFPSAKSDIPSTTPQSG